MDHSISRRGTHGAEYWRTGAAQFRPMAVAILALTVAAFSQAINTLLDVDPRTAGSIAFVANTPAIFSYFIALIAA